MLAAEGVITVTNADLLTLMFTLEGEENVAYSMVLSPDGRLVALGTGYPNNVIRLWELDTGLGVAVLTPGYVQDVRNLSFNMDGSLLAVSGNVGDPVQIWNVTTEGQVTVLDDEISGHAFQMAFNPTENTLVYADGQDIVGWDVDSGGESTRWVSELGLPTSLAFSPDGMFLAVGDVQGFIEIWDVATGTLVYTVRHRQSENVRPISGLVFMPDSGILASVNCHQPGSYQGSCVWGKVSLWDIETGERLTGLDILSANSYEFYENIRLAFNSDGALLAATSMDTLWLFDVATGQAIDSRSSVKSWVLTFSPDGMQLVSAGTDAVVQVWGMPASNEGE